MTREKPRASAVTEWQGHWPLPLAAALGASATSLHIYSMGPFFQPLQDAFHWSRADVSAGVTLAISGGALLNPAVGLLLDRIGPRRVALAGIATITGAMALLGTATGGLANWIALWVLVAIGGLLVQPMIWTAAVASRFDAGRGIAIGLTLCGPALGTTIFPLLGAWLIEHYGWRLGFVGLGATWAVLLLPVVFLFFRGAQDGNHAGRPVRVAADILPGLAASDGLRSAAFYKLMLAGSLFTFTLVGITVHLVPIIVDRGLTPIAAAAIAGLVGVFSVVGRLAAGSMLDELEPRLVALASCLFPIVGCGLLLAPGGWWAQAVAAATIGLALGSEFQLVTYLATEHLGLKRFGLLFGIIMVPMALGTATGPLVASRIYDRFASYDPFLWLTMPLMAVAALGLTLLGPAPDFATRASL